MSYILFTYTIFWLDLRCNCIYLIGLIVKQVILVEEGLAAPAHLQSLGAEPPGPHLHPARVVRAPPLPGLVSASVLSSHLRRLAVRRRVRVQGRFTAPPHLQPPSAEPARPHLHAARVG